MADLKVEYVPIDSLQPYENNAKLHPAEQIEQIKKSIQDYGFRDPVGVWRGQIVEGHGRILAAKELGLTEVPVIRLDDMTDEQRREYALVHNQTTMNSGFDFAILDGELEGLPDFDAVFYGFDLEYNKPKVDDVEYLPLNDQFVVPPFSILDTRKGYWREREDFWELNIGKTTKTREHITTLSLTFDKKKYRQNNLGEGVAVSEFSPTVCEIMYRWFCPKGGTIFDCFAGGAVRGLVAVKLGHNYIGIDLRQDQIDANIEKTNGLGLSPVWLCDDSLNADKYIDDDGADMIFTCPPYFDLEKYSDDERDISNMNFDDFCKTYKKIIEISCRKLKNNRFAVFVIGDVRDRSGAYRGLIDFTKSCLKESGLVAYNEIILIHSDGSAPLRARRFMRSRKVLKVHENILVFYKGDTKKIKENYDEIDIDDSVFEED